MTTRTTPFPAGTPCWIDLLTSDPERSRAFYTAVLDWEFTEPSEEFGGYVNALFEGEPVAGVMRNYHQSGAHDGWTTYLATDDIDATLRDAVAAGGQVLSPAMAVGDLGSMAVLLDPSGGSIGVWQAGRHIGFTRYDEPGALTWVEQHSRDFGASKAFYAAVFGWEYEVTSDTEAFRYVTALLDGQPVAGLMDAEDFLPDGEPTHWALYFSVADADEAAVVAMAAGATVVMAPTDTPFGRVADMLDPLGVSFKLHAAVPADAGSSD